MRHRQTPMGTAFRSKQKRLGAALMTPPAVRRSMTYNLAIMHNSFDPT